MLQLTLWQCILYLRKNTSLIFYGGVYHFLAVVKKPYGSAIPGTQGCCWSFSLVGWHLAHQGWSCSSTQRWVWSSPFAVVVPHWRWVPGLVQVCRCLEARPAAVASRSLLSYPSACTWHVSCPHPSAQTAVLPHHADTPSHVLVLVSRCSTPETLVTLRILQVQSKGKVVPGQTLWSLPEVSM